jgi:hypothetical protein
MFVVLNQSLVSYNYVNLNNVPQSHRELIHITQINEKSACDMFIRLIIQIKRCSIDLV